MRDGFSLTFLGLPWTSLTTYLESLLSVHVYICHLFIVWQIKQVWQVQHAQKPENIWNCQAHWHLKSSLANTHHTHQVSWSDTPQNFNIYALHLFETSDICLTEFAQEMSKWPVVKHIARTFVSLILLQPLARHSQAIMLLTCSPVSTISNKPWKLGYSRV